MLRKEELQHIWPMDSKTVDHHGHIKAAELDLIGQHLAQQKLSPSQPETSCRMTYFISITNEAIREAVVHASHNFTALTFSRLAKAN